MAPPPPPGPGGGALALQLLPAAALRKARCRRPAPRLPHRAPHATPRRGALLPAGLPLTHLTPPGPAWAWPEGVALTVSCLRAPPDRLKCPSVRLPGRWGWSKGDDSQPLRGRRVRVAAVAMATAGTRERRGSPGGKARPGHGAVLPHCRPPFTREMPFIKTGRRRMAHVAWSHSWTDPQAGPAGPLRDTSRQTAPDVRSAAHSSKQEDAAAFSGVPAPRPVPPRHGP